MCSVLGLKLGSTWEIGESCRRRRNMGCKCWLGGCPFSRLGSQSLLVTTPISNILSAIHWKFLSNFFFDIPVTPNFYQNFGRVSPMLRGPKLSTKSYYTSNFNSHLDPMILDLNPTHHHQHNTCYSITSYNVIQVKDLFSTLNMHG
jgi:hypothetical protein